MARSAADADHGTPNYPPLYTPFKWFTRQLTPVLRDTRLSPNLVTVGWGALLIAASTAFALEARWLAAGLVLLAITLDCLDGDLARSRRQPSSAGTYLEQIAHCVGNMALVAGAGAALLLAGPHRGDVALVASLTVAQAVYIAVVRQIRPDSAHGTGPSVYRRAFTMAARALWYLSPIELPIVVALVLFGPTGATLLAVTVALTLASLALFVPHFMLVRADDRRRWESKALRPETAPRQDALARRMLETDWWIPGVPCLPAEVRTLLGAPSIPDASPVLRTTRLHLGTQLPELFRSSGQVVPLAYPEEVVRAGLVEALSSPGSTVLLVGGRSAVTRWRPTIEHLHRGVALVGRRFGCALDLSEFAGLEQSPAPIDLVIVAMADPEDGVLIDAPATLEACRRVASTVIVDASLSLLADDLRMDAWGVDATLASSSGGVMAPAGACLLALGESAQAMLGAPASLSASRAISGSNLLSETRGALPANSLLGLHRSVAMVRKIGLDAFIARQQAQAAALRDLCWEGVGVVPVAHERTAACTTYLLPEHLAPSEVLDQLWREAHIVIGHGRTPDGEPTVNIGHSALRTDEEVERVASALVRALRSA